MRKILILAVSTTALFLTACNTISGLGKDVSAAGDAVSKKAEEVKK